MPSSPSSKILLFPNPPSWRKWLSLQSSTSPAVLLSCLKTNHASPSTTLTYATALDEALCYGWIDSGGGKHAHDDNLRIVRFGPRRPKGLWSKRNVGYIERLTREGRMAAPGLEAVREAKGNGQWEKAYAGAATDEAMREGLPDFVAALEANPAAKEGWERLSKGERFKVYFRLLSLKTEAGRQKRVKERVEDLARGKVSTSSQKGSGEAKVTRTKTKSQLESRPAVNMVDVIATTPETTARTTRSGRRMPSYVE